MAVFDPNDLVKLGEERQAMRDEHHDAVCCPFAQPCHNRALGCLVHGGEGVVEHVEGPLACERAGKGKACLLAAGEAHPACAHERVCALRHRRDLLVELYQAQCGLRVQVLAQADIGPHGVAQKLGVMAQVSHRLAQLVGGHCAQLGLAQADAALVGLLAQEHLAKR